MTNFIIWNGSPELFSLDNAVFPISLRWYGLLFALGFLVSQQVLYYIYKKEGKPTKDVDTLTVYMVIASIIGARLGHVIFYEPELFIENPISVLLPISLDPFRFTGFMGLASHGGAIGILFALWLYARKKKPGQNYLQVVDRIVIVVAITGAFIRLGNFFNHEILGVPTTAPTAIVFVNPVTETVHHADKNSIVESIEYKIIDEASTERPLVNMYIFFNERVNEIIANQFINSEVHYILSQNETYVDHPYFEQLNVQMSKLQNGSVGAIIKVHAYARHPAQLYESFSCILLFVLLFWIWSRKKENTPSGLLFGIFMIVLWSLRFLYEFIKENQVSFEDDLMFNMGQILSLPMILIGFFLVFYALRKNRLST